MRRIIIISLLLGCMLWGSCAPTRDFDKQLNSIVQPYTFSIMKWEFKVLGDGIKQLFSSREEVEDESEAVRQYFILLEQIETLESQVEVGSSDNKYNGLSSVEGELARLKEQRAALENIVEKVLKNQISEILLEQGILNPLDQYIELKVNFPPISFELEKPPYLLVVSPRDKIESAREIILRQDITLEEMEELEGDGDRLGISSLVVKLGGLGATYPAFVTDEASLRFTISTVIEEWLHQYLVFRPLGFRYLLDLIGVSRDYDIATMNETLAGIVSEEIGAMVHERYYSLNESTISQIQAVESGFDFNREMREIRRVVDEYLDQGEIEKAEAFMESKQRYLAFKGYYIRKLNQAYFAFHGIYADEPTSISPIGFELKQLREQSASLRDFLNTVGAMSSHQDLIDELEEEAGCVEV